MKENTSFKLFDDEIAAYHEAIRYLEREALEEDELINKFKNLISKYNRLINTARRLCSISDVQSKNLKRRESEIKNLLDHADQGFLTFKNDLLVDQEYSAECLRIFKKKISNMNILELLHSENNDQNQLFESVFLSVFSLPEMDSKLSCLNSLPNLIKIGENFINIKYKIIVTDDYEENDERLMLILTDITERRKAEDQVMFLSYHDKLTSLFNRAYVESIVPQLQIESNLPLSIIMADLNALKLVNDVFGHEYGDKLIVNAAKVFLNCCRKSDVIARWGGDEFVIILLGANQEVCERICNNIKTMFSSLPADPIELSATLGAATIENWHNDVISLINLADSVMYSNKLIESSKTRKKIVFSLQKILQDKCPAYIGHNERIEEIALRFVKLPNFRLEQCEIANLCLLAQLHDIGKATIPIELLNKSTDFTDEEFQIMHKYPEIGFRMAQSIGEPALAHSILAVREQWSGGGYPYGLKGDQIPIIARVIAIIEVYDILTHDRPYKERMSHEEALRELECGAGTQFDPNLVKLFLDNICDLVNI
jgi:diguanylate cyclase (GGDEF) domain